MQIILASDRAAMGKWVAAQAASEIRTAITANGHARIVIATGASQFEVLAELAQQPDLDWSKVMGFHLDEYIGLSADHGASFCRYLKERFVDLVPLAAFHYLPGDQDAHDVIKRVGGLLQQAPIDVALVGIGENGHLAFNDPPADFQTQLPYLIVDLDEACRNQQVGEGWFADLDEVPRQAISMSVSQIMKAKRIFCSVPDTQKADAVQKTIEGPISEMVPASILRQHPAVTLIIDQASAANLSTVSSEHLERVQ